MSAVRSRTAWAFLAPGLILLAISVLIPALMALVISFTRSGLDVSEPLQFIGLANIRRLLTGLLEQQCATARIVEIVVVASGCTDDTADVARELGRGRPGVHVHVQEQIGRAHV